MADERRLAIVDPSGRLIADLGAAAGRVNVTLAATPPAAAPPEGCAALLIAPLSAPELPPPAEGGPPRWIVGDGANPSRVAGAAAQASAAGVLLTPVAPASLEAIARAAPAAPEQDLVRARALIATSVIDLSGPAREALRAVADGFGAADCIVWWREGRNLTPTAARPHPSEGYRVQIAGAARIASAAAGTVIAGGDEPRAVIAEALRSGPTEVAGLVALIADAPRRFSEAERSDLRALAARLARELSWLGSHRRLVAEGERLLAASLYDPLTGAMTRGAFEQTLAHEAAAANRRDERLTLAVIDIVSLRRINLAHGHRVGDEVLAQAASRIRATVRGNDPIARLGGDELGVLLVGATASQALPVVRKLIQNIQAEPLQVHDGSALHVSVRAVATELGISERSGEAALARCYGSLRGAPAGDVRVIGPDERAAEDASAGVDASSLSAGTVLGGVYRVLHELSRGAMGVVYRCEDMGLARPVAIKVLRSDLASDSDLVARFRAEASLLASLHHPNLVQVFALGEHAGDVYFAMELVEGQPLSEVLHAALERKEWLPAAAVTQIALEIGDALDAMHERGLIHRDVKPANILLDRERDRAVLVDVGIAVKAGDRGDAAGTPGFAAPESFLERSDAPTTDVYGLGATVYCMLTGRAPFGSGPAPQVVHRQLHDPIVPPSQHRQSLSEAVDAVVVKALHPTPKKRWSSASTFAIALGRALERLPANHLSARLSPTGDPTKMAELLLAPTAGLDAPDPDEVMQTLRRRTAGGRVRAAHLRVLSRLLRHHLGESGMAKIVAEAPHLASALAATLAPLSWIELGDLVEALDRARASVPNQLMPRKVGRGTMSATFARLYGAEPSSLSAEKVMAALPVFWSRYHDWGEAEVTVHPGEADVALRGYPGSKDICAMVAAELERVVELTGAEGVTATHPACVCAGAERCEYQVRWNAA
ncbi:MAG TPA: diguanylate cyclase [Kofleriaceae bacterium]|nr:diguanylate cyclase [Kofleriaceae bacterium]